MAVWAHVVSLPPIRPPGGVEVARIKWKLLLMTFAQTFKKFQHFLKMKGIDGPISSKFLSELICEVQLTMKKRSGDLGTNKKIISMFCN